VGQKQGEKYMTQDEIIEMARQCGIVVGYPKYQDIEAFAKLVAEKEREACAKIADGWPDYDVQGLAEAIRARGQA
jgi:hypothetical protein